MTDRADIKKRFRTSWEQLTYAPDPYHPPSAAGGSLDRSRLDALERVVAKLSRVPQVDMNSFKAWYEELARDRQIQQFIEAGSPEGEAIQVFTKIVTEIRTTKVTLDLGNYRLRFDEKRDAVLWEKKKGGQWVEFATAARRT